MDKQIWKDITSFSRSEPLETREPRTWQLETRNLRIVVTKGHIYHPKRWVLSCHQIGLDTVNICADEHTAEEAQMQAIRTVKLRLKALSDELKDLG